MKEFFIQNKVFIIVVLATLGLLFGGVALFSRGGNSNTQNTKVESTILEPKDSYKTAGIANGKYLEASKTATVTLVEFGDYQCPACVAYHPLVKDVITEFSGKMNFVFRNFPLPQHKNANISAYAAEAAGLQGKFWEMHDKIYENDKDWVDLADPSDVFIGYAKGLNLNTDQFKKDMNSQTVKTKVTRDTNDGNLIKVNSTPSYFLNGVKLDNPASLEEFRKLINDAMKNNPITQSESSTKYHAHFDLKVLINGVALDLSLPQYQSTEGKELNQYIHLHDKNGKVVHIHKDGIALKDFFDSIKVNLPVNTEAYVNGKKIDNILSYVPKDLDQILIGSSNLKLVSNDACIYSEKCPERGKAPTEECVGGIGTDCVKE